MMLAAARAGTRFLLDLPPGALWDGNSALLRKRKVCKPIFYHHLRSAT